MVNLFPSRLCAQKGNTMNTTVLLSDRAVKEAHQDEAIAICVMVAEFIPHEHINSVSAFTLEKIFNNVAEKLHYFSVMNA